MRPGRTGWVVAASVGGQALADKPPVAPSDQYHDRQGAAAGTGQRAWIDQGPLAHARGTDARRRSGRVSRAQPGDLYPRSKHRRRGVSLVEATISVVVVGVMLVGVMNTVGGATMGRQYTGETVRARLLAEQLMAEILAKPYEDPDGPPIAFGHEVLEITTRAGKDDVDDYNAWSATPPQEDDGTVMSHLTGWERTVSVAWQSSVDMSQLDIKDSGIKRVTVTVSHNGTAIAQLSALATAGLPSPEDISIKVLMVVGDAATLTAQEEARKTLMTTWGYKVSTIADSAPQSEYDGGLKDADVAYVPETILDTMLGTKLVGTTLGVVNEEMGLADEFGFCANASPGTTLYIVAWTGTTHYIMEPFGTSYFSPFTSSQPVFVLNGSIAPGLVPIAASNTQGPNFYGSAAAFDTGDSMLGGGTAAGRRVLMPWGSAGFDINALNVDGQTLMMRALEWAAGTEQAGAAAAVCGDGTCDTVNELCSCAADCPAIPPSETAGTDCADGVDNDCDGLIDCADANCAGDPTCTCGNSICDTGEDCTSCPGDCASVLSGKKDKQYCCGNGVLEKAEGDGTICDGNP